MMMVSKVRDRLLARIHGKVSCVYEMPYSVCGFFLSFKSYCIIIILLCVHSEFDLSFGAFIRTHSHLWRTAHHGI